MKPGTLKRTSLVLVLAGLVAGGLLYRGHPLASSARASSAELAAVASQPPAPPAVASPAATQPAALAAAQPAAAAAVAVRGLPDFTTIVRQYGPAVVNVSTVGNVKTAAAEPQGQGDDPAEEFFRRFGVPHPRGDQLTRGIGSGFIVKPDGVILTNAHVVANASEVTVKLTDKREFRAKVIGLDKDTDVAVLKIEARDLPTVKIGDASRVQVGEWVLAIGAPFGFENSATAGVVSARARSLPGEGYVPFLQTDVAVNPGNSGGPLFNLAGEVVGINSQIFSGSGGYMGISFAIPIDVVMKVQRQLLATGKVTRGRLGVMVQDVNQQLAQSFGLPRPSGALVSNVEKDGPGARAGLQPGDVILSLDGQDISGSNDLPPRVADIQPGSTARLGVWRGGKRTEVEVKVGAAQDAVASAGGKDAPERGRLGVTVRPLSPQEQRQAEVQGGAVIEGVNGPAARAGLQPGDVVLAVNGTPVSGVDQLKGLVAKAKDHVALLVQRGDARIFVPVDLG